MARQDAEDAGKREALPVEDRHVLVVAAPEIAQHPDAADLSRALRRRLAVVRVVAPDVDQHSVAFEAGALQHDPANEAVPRARAVDLARSGRWGIVVHLPRGF
jgi:hypothetical protein